MKYKLSLPVIILLLCFQPVDNALCQDTNRIHTVFTSDARFGYLWSAGLKLNSVFNKISGSADFYGGLLINEQILLGAAGGINVGYPGVNYGYIGMLGQYIYKPENFIHYSWQTTLCYGSLNVTDQGNPQNKTNTRFYFVEPGANIEINLMRTLRLMAGIGYRFVPSRQEAAVSDPFFTKSDLHGLNFRIGIISGRLLDVLK